MLDTKVTLRVFSNCIDLLAMKEILGEPSKGYSKGDVFSKGNKARENSYWSLESSLSPSEKFESHVTEILNYFESKDDVFSRIKNECEVDLFCMLSSNNGQGGFSLPVSLSDKLSKQRLDIVFDIYSESADL